MIEEAHPLKQGLKLRHGRIKTREEWDRRGSSIKTRIETETWRRGRLPDGKIEEAHPLKQGLKHDFLREEGIMEEIEEAHPLKQGLKLQIQVGQLRPFFHRRGSSIKTRIETRLWPHWHVSPQLSKRLIH